jgi:hypothetical protein
MTQSACWYQTTIPINNAIRAGYVWPDFKQMTNKIKAIDVSPQDILDPTWIAQLAALKISDITTAIFYNAENFARDSTHTDINGTATNPKFISYAFNLVIGQDTKDMVWFDPDALRYGYTEAAYKNQYGDAVVGDWPLDLSHEIDRARIGNHLTLVRVDVPHWISLSDQPRLCISLRCNSPDMEMLSWEQATDLFKDILVAR